MNLFDYPGTVMTLILGAFCWGMIALYLRLPQGLWRAAVTLCHLGRRAAHHARHLVARGVATAGRWTFRATPSAHRLAFRLPRLTRPRRARGRIIVLDADPSARRIRVEQLRGALVDMSRAHFVAPHDRFAVEVASEARYRGTAYVAYLVRDRTGGSIRVRLAARTPDGAAIDVDKQHTHLADLFPHLIEDDPAVTFVGLPIADPSSPVVIGPARTPYAGDMRQGIRPETGATAGVSPSGLTRIPALNGSAEPTCAAAVADEPVPVGAPGDAELHIPYADHDAPTQ